MTDQAHIKKEMSDFDEAVCAEEFEQFLAKQGDGDSTLGGLFDNSSAASEQLKMNLAKFMAQFMAQKQEAMETSRISNESIISTPSLNSNESAIFATPSLGSTVNISPDSGVDSPEDDEENKENENPNNAKGDVKKDLTPRVVRPRKPKERKSYCKVCKSMIYKEGQRSQGPRRHIMQHHLMRPVFKCPLCRFTSNYDKAHINAHLKRIHGSTEHICEELDRHVYAKEERLWDFTCFGKDSTGEVSAELATIHKMAQDNLKNKDDQAMPDLTNPGLQAPFGVLPFPVNPMVPPAAALLNAQQNLIQQIILAQLVQAAQANILSQGPPLPQGDSQPPSQNPPPPPGSQDYPPQSPADRPPTSPADELPNSSTDDDTLSTTS